MDCKNHRILIIGGSGFVGRHLINQLLGDGFCVTVLSRNTPNMCTDFCKLPDYSPSSIACALRGKKFHSFIHLTGAGSAPSDRNILTLTRINAILPGVIVEAAASVGAKAVIMAGSYAEYSPPLNQELLSERSPVEDNEPYGASKAAGGEFALAQGKFYNIPVAVGRLFNLYGPNDSLRHRLFPSLIDKLMLSHDVPLSMGQQHRDFVYIKDACSALILMMKALSSGSLEPGTYNIASGIPTSVADFAKMTANSLQVGTHLLKFGALPPRTVPDAEFMVGDPSLLRTKIGWSCQHTLEQGLRESIIEERKRSENIA